MPTNPKERFWRATLPLSKRDAVENHLSAMLITPEPKIRKCTTRVAADNNTFEVSVNCSGPQRASWLASYVCPSESEEKWHVISVSEFRNQRRTQDFKDTEHIKRLANTGLGDANDAGQLNSGDELFNSVVEMVDVDSALETVTSLAELNGLIRQLEGAKKIKLCS